MILVIFGAPGVGKGTQAELLSERKGIPHISTGAALRQAIEDGTELGKTAQQFVEAGKLVPDNIVTGIVRETLNHEEYKKGCILDGFPRTMAQAATLDEILKEQGREITCVLNVDVDNNEIVQRMLNRGRKDDTEEIIRERLNIYSSSTFPLLEYYKQRGKLCTIDGNGTIEDVYNRIASLIKD
jgi:adenylate kinase